MKKVFVFLFILGLTISGTSSSVAFASDMAYKETILDQGWDWFTTLGKSGLEKERILVENKAERLKRYSEKLAKQMSQDANNVAADAKKKLGF